MRSNKNYYNIREVSQMIGIKEHVIRHWDSIDPKTKKLRIEDLSLRTKGGTRFFNKTHIKKLLSLKNILDHNGRRNYSLDLASKIISNTKYSKIISNSSSASTTLNDSNINDSIKITNNIQKITNITNKLKKLL